MHGLNQYYSKARMQEFQIPHFTTRDPLCEKYYDVSPYGYCNNNLMRFIDPSGMNYTDYRNDKGELLFKTSDGISDIIIVRDPDVAALEKKGEKLEEEGKLNDPQANKEVLHPLGKDITEYKNSYKTGNDNVDNGYVIGYDVTYNGKSGIATTIWMYIQGVSDEGAQILGGYHIGKSEGQIDRIQGRINRLEPFKGLKNNKPLIKFEK